MIEYNNSKILKLAAIDIGSNAVRLLITNVIPTRDHTYYQKVSIIRLPIRLGADSFPAGKISRKNSKRLLKGIRSYKLLMEVHGVEDYRACATSALREAKNGDELTKEVFSKTGINIEIIDGKEEAKLIFAAKLFDKIHPKEDSFLYIDVGGGSTELTLFHRGKLVNSQSFRIGTVRLLNNIVKAERWKEMQDWIEANIRGIDNIAMIGSGGNINRTFKMSGKKPGEPLEYNYIAGFLDELKGYSKEELITIKGLNLDRADVIFPALQIYLFATEKAGAMKMYVPKIGVNDGIIRDLYHRKYREEYESSL
jgi:exopolyphosphatase/guanosine-5'-triphosphate,3'-diphosphate pyrophosphatase